MKLNRASRKSVYEDWSWRVGWLAEPMALFSSVGNAWSGGPLIELEQDFHELASQQDERAPQYEGNAIE